MVRVENLTKRYRLVQAVKDVSLEVAQGEVLAILGPSGCGKTSLLRLIAGFEKPDRGAVWIDGVKVSSPDRLSPPHKRNVSMIFQDLALWPHMMVKEHITFVIGRNNSPRYEEVIENTLRKVNLSGVNNCYPHQLSGGERQRLAIARAVASNPIYLLMDEPFTNLDHILKGELQNMIMELKGNFSMGIIYVTHSIDEAFFLADKIAIMNKAVIEQIGSKEEIMSNPGNEFIKTFLKLK